LERRLNYLRTAIDHLRAAGLHQEADQVAEELEAWAAAAGFASTQSQYLAQKNGFQVQIHHYQKPSDGPKA